MKRISCFFLLYCTVAFGQPPLLERKMTLTLSRETVESSLIKISTAGGFVFSYNPAILAGRKNVTRRFVNRSVREILDEIFEGTVQYKIRGNYIILTSAAPKSSAKNEPAIVTGYVVDEATGERLKDVSVYDPVTLSSTITDSYGYFEIKIDRPPDEIILSVNLQNYTDTVVAVQSRERLLNIPIRINRDKIAVLADSVSRKLTRFWERQAALFENANVRNIDDTLYRIWQVSLVPFVGTNHKMSAHVINDFSLNIFGGYAMGIEKLEIGGLFNLVRGDMNGAQFAGMFNGVGGDMRGLQLAGILNGNYGKTSGPQVAGVMNLNLHDSRGPLLAGVANINSRNVRGPQVAGVFNVTGRESSSLQLAGVYNTASAGMTGMQTAGVFNVIAGDHRGMQLAGVFNVAGKRINGAQIAGVLNVAGKVRGIQLGLINVADTVSGIPIGFMSIVWKGYHKIEVSADEIFYNNVSWRTGVNRFYNIFTAGAKPSTYKESETIWTFGYGVGTAPRLSRKLFLNLDVTANQIVQGDDIDKLNLLNKLYVGFDYQAFKKLSLTLGATVNGYITKMPVDQYPALFTDYQPDIFYDRNFGSDRNLKMWMGAKVGIRFL